MFFAIRDKVSGFFLAVDPTPTIRFLLRESVDNATSFESRSVALDTLDAAATYFEGRYSDYELEVRPMTNRRKEILRRSELPAGLQKAASGFLMRALSGDDAPEDS